MAGMDRRSNGLFSAGEQGPATEEAFRELLIKGEATLLTAIEHGTYEELMHPPMPEEAGVEAAVPAARKRARA